MPDPFSTLDPVEIRLLALLSAAQRIDAPADVAPPPAGKEAVAALLEGYAWHELRTPQDIDALPAQLALAPNFARALKGGARGYAAAVSEALGEQEVPLPLPVSQRTREVVFTVAHRKRPLLCPWTGELAFADHSLGREWFLHRGAEKRVCIAGTASETMHHADRDTIWICPAERTVFFLASGYPLYWIKEQVSTLFLLLLGREADVARYLAEPVAGVGVTDFWCPHISHGLWNMQTGWDYVIRNVDAGRIDRFICFDGQSMYGWLNELYRREVPPEKIALFTSDAQVFEMMLEGRLLLATVKDEHISETLVAKVLHHAKTRSDPAFLERAARFRAEHFPVVLLTLRLDNRAWLEQETGIPALMLALAADFPQVGFILDGLSRDAVMGWTTSWMALSADERVAAAIVEAVGDRVPVLNGVGTFFHESIVLADACDFFVAPIGSGLALHKWIANKPGVAFSNAAVLERGGKLFHDHTEWDRNRDGLAPTFYLAETCVRDDVAARDAASRGNFSMDWQDLHALVRTALAGEIKDGRISPRPARDGDAVTS